MSAGTMYIAGPMTGYPQYNWRAFDDYARAWIARKWDVVTPFHNDSIVWQRHFGRDFDPKVDVCDYDSPLLGEMMVENVRCIAERDAIAFLPGWRQSKGANLEHGFGLALGKALYDATTFELLTDESICAEADRLVALDRQQDYGHPLDDFSKTAAMWSAILGTTVTAEHVPLCMIAVKISREVNRPKRDNLTDIAGYAKTLHLVHSERKRRSTGGTPR